MAHVKVLVEGYARIVNGEEYASSTATLIQDSGFNVIVDPGMDRVLLQIGLEKAGLLPSDIHFVVITHTHLDHSLLAAMFENAKVLDCSEIFSWDGRIQKNDGKVPGTKIEIIATPGHDPAHCSVIATTTEGTVAIAGDVFWWMDGEQPNLEREDPYAKSKSKLHQSRKRLLEIADIIIPGHGKMFEVK
jgi:glyoxylase-like metal-dependent hydrolase (beta-lactamase superfamily II)